MLDFYTNPFEFVIVGICISIYFLYRTCKWFAKKSRGEPPPRGYYPPYQKPPEEQPQTESPATRHWKPSEHEVTVTVCTGCGRWNNPAKEECWKCSKTLAAAPQHTEKMETSRHCVVCRAEIFPGEKIIICPNCQIQGHHSEFLEFMKVKGECPGCGQRLRPSQLLDAEPLD